MDPLANPALARAIEKHNIGRVGVGLAALMNSETSGKIRGGSDESTSERAEKLEGAIF